MHASDPAVAASDERLLGALAMAAFMVDGDCRIGLANDAAGELLGTRPADLAGALLLPRLFAEPEQGAAEEILGRVMGGERWQGELQVLRHDGLRAPPASRWRRSSTPAVRRAR